MRLFFRVVMLSFILFSALESSAQTDDMAFFVVTWNAEQGSTIWRVTLPDEHITEIATFDRLSDDIPANILPPAEYALVEEYINQQDIDLSTDGSPQLFVQASVFDESHLVVVLEKHLCTFRGWCFGVFDISLLNIYSGEIRLLDRQPLHRPLESWADCVATQLQFGEFTINPRRDVLAYTLFPMSLHRSFTCSQIVLVDFSANEAEPQITTFAHADHPAWSPDGTRLSYVAYTPCEAGDCHVAMHIYKLSTASDFILAESQQRNQLPVSNTWLDGSTLIYGMRDPDLQGDVPQTLYTHDFTEDETIAIFPSPILHPQHPLITLRTNEGEARLIAETYDQLVALEAEFPHTTIAELTINTAGLQVINDRYLITQVKNGRFTLIDADLQTTDYDFSGLFGEDQHISSVFLAPIPSDE